MAVEEKVKQKEDSTLTLDDYVEKAGSLDAMPHVAKKILEAVTDENANVASLSAIVEKDPNVTARILKVANSAFYSLSTKVTTIQQAIMILGFRNLRSLAVSCSSKSLHKNFGEREQAMWDISVGTAIGARLIAEKNGRSVADAAFVGGILHNLGKLIMNNIQPKEYEECLALVRQKKMSQFEAQRQIFGFPYHELGGLVAEKWGLPEELIGALKFHPLSQISEEERKALSENTDNLKVCASIELAAALCGILGLGGDEAQDVDPMSLESVKVLEISKEKVDQLVEEIRQAHEQEASALN